MSKSLKKYEEIISRLEDEITNLEGVKYHCNERLNDAIERFKKLRFDLKYGDLKYGDKKE